MKKRGLLASASLIAYTYVGTVVGAGFASGQEIMGFFTVHGRDAIWAILISFILFILIGTKILLLGMELKALSFDKIIGRTFGIMAPFVNIYLLFAMMVINVAMLAGAGAMFEEFGKSSYLIGVMVTGLVTIITVALGIRSILSINRIIVLAILFFQVVVFIITLKTRGVGIGGRNEFVRAEPAYLFYRGLTYASFNLILSTGVLASLGYEFKDRNVLKLGGILGGGILGAMLVSTHYCLLAHMPHIFDYEIPMLFIISQIGIEPGSWMIPVAYGLILWGGIFTTLIGNLFSMISFIHEKYGFNHLYTATIIICLAIIISPMGFSSIVKTLYPILGLVGIIFIIAILFFRASKGSYRS